MGCLKYFIISPYVTFEDNRLVIKSGKSKKQKTQRTNNHLQNIQRKLKIELRKQH